MERELLPRGARVGVVAPGFAVRRDRLHAGVGVLRDMGFEVVLGRSVERRDGYLAGTDDERVRDLNGFLRDPRVQAVWFARGGYGTARLLPRVDRAALRSDSKLLVGYSDATALFSVSLRNPTQICLHAPMVAELSDPERYHARSLEELLAGKPSSIRFRRSQVLRSGRAEGRLVGGNLTVLVHLLGTDDTPRFDGAVLFLEETGEESYRLDRLLQHLRMTGSLDRLAGVLLGGFSPPPTARSFPPDRPLRKILADFFLPLGVPVVTGLPVGHVRGARTLPLGGTARLDTAAGTLDLIPRPPSAGKGRRR